MDPTSIQVDGEQARSPSAAPVTEWSDPAPGSPLPFWQSVASDIQAHVAPAKRPRSRRGWCWVGLSVVVGSSGFHAVLLYRLAHTARGRLGGVGRLLARLNFWFSRHWYGCSLASTARLHGGLILPHPQGIVVGAGVILGPRAWVFQNVTLGGAPEREGMPHIGADARIYAGAVVTGPVTVGDNVMIGANAVVAENVPSRSLVRPPPSLCQPLPPRYLTDPGDA
jgi:serine acetyltransferase